MARIGLDKSAVKLARDTLLSQNRYPSVDAVRIELGNTGSKSTIHKYLKELEEQDDSNQLPDHHLSDVLQQMVSRLAEQLQTEADLKIEEIKQHYSEKEQHIAGQLRKLQQQLDDIQIKLSQTTIDLTHTLNDKDQLTQALHAESITRHTLDQQVADLKDLLAENNAHRQSLEEKHQHAQRSLEHYRDAMKEQREQDNRRHEHQVQQLQAELRQLQQTIIIKQEQINSLTSDNIKLSTKLDHQHQDFVKLTHDHQQLVQTIADVKQHEQTLNNGLNEKNAALSISNKKLNEMMSSHHKLQQQFNRVEKENIAYQAKLEAQQGMFEQVQHMFNKIVKPS